MHFYVSFALRAKFMAERVGFEPTEPGDPLAFKASAIDHSAIAPLQSVYSMAFLK